MTNFYFAKPHGMQHCYIRFLYAIDFKGVLSFGEAQVLRVDAIGLREKKSLLPKRSLES
jgi:hypothetical protein